MYWTDWSKQAIMRADKNTGQDVRPVRTTHMRGIMDLKILHRQSHACEWFPILHLY